jgi:hypothetical protein
MGKACRSKKQFEHVSDQALQEELIYREADRRAEENRRNVVNAAFVLQHVNALLALVPTHDTINCTDANTASAYLDHGRARCRRCMLLHINQHQLNDDVGLEVSLVELVQQDNTPDRLQVMVKER